MAAVAALACGLVGAGEPTHAASAGDAERGRLVYEEGRLPDGRALPAQRGTLTLTAADAACAKCHRPSGFGGTEGGVRVPPITGPVLFAAGRPPEVAAQLKRQWLRHQTRSAYTADSLARALAEGVDPDGQALSNVMPRYRLPAQDLADLIAYLQQRGRSMAPGLDGGAMHLATVFTPDAPPERRQVVQQTLQRWAQTTGLGARRLVWQAWTLQGPPATWAMQLAGFWQRQPVYALVSGAGGSEWGPVDAWCEAQAVPCLFPVVDKVPQGAARRWSVYLSAGVDGEARMLAELWRSRPPVKLVQWVDSGAGQAAAQRLAAALAPAGSVAPPHEVLAWPAAKPHRPVAGEVAVLWLSPAHVRAWLAAAPAPAAATQVFVSAQLAPPQRVVVPDAWRPGLRWVGVRSDPVRQSAGAALSLAAWAQRLQLPTALDDPDLADVHAGTFFFADAFARSHGITDPLYLLERLEVAVDLRPAGAAYQRLSLGPGQRIAAQGGQLLAWQGPGLKRLGPLPGHLRAID